MGIAPILCVAGTSGAGKTTLLERLIPALTARGVKVGVVKRAGSGLSADPADKDSARLAAAGARPSIAVGGGDVSVQFAQEQAQLLDLAAAYCGGCDLVLAEGFKKSAYDKIQVLSADDANSHESIVTVLLSPDCHASAKTSGGAPNCADQQAGRHVGLPVGAVGPSRRKILGNQTKVDEKGDSRNTARDTARHGQDAHATLESVRLVVGPQADAAKGIVGRDDVGAIADWVVAWLKRRLLLGRDVMGAVMVGGQSRRMGADKAAMQFEGRAVLPRLVELLGGRLPEVWTIGRPVAVAGLPQCVRWHLDLRSGAGPLAGIATALRVARANGPRAVLAVACDMPALTGDVLDFLLEHRRPEKYATVLRNGQTGFLEPLAAVYEPRILEPIEQALDAGERSVVKLLESAGAHGVEVPAELAAALVNVNTPDELNVLRRNAQDTVYTDDPERI